MAYMIERRCLRALALLLLFTFLVLAVCPRALADTRGDDEMDGTPHYIL